MDTQLLVLCYPVYVTFTLTYYTTFYFTISLLLFIIHVLEATDHVSHPRN